MYQWQLRVLQSMLVVSVLVVSGSLVQALPMNTRPVDVGQNSKEESLQEIFNGITANDGTIDVIGAQTNFALFTNQASGGVLASFVIEVAGFASQNQFGIYSAQNSDTKGSIFSGSHNQGDQADITFLSNGNIVIVTKDFEGGNLVGLGSSTVEGFGNMFGFYIHTPEDNFFYTEDALNLDKNPQALVYQGAGQPLTIPGLQGGAFTPDHFILAFEDLPFTSSDKDFQDLVVLVESVSPVHTPEPSTMLLLGTGLLAMAGYGWRRQQQMQ